MTYAGLLRPLGAPPCGLPAFSAPNDASALAIAREVAESLGFRLQDLWETRDGMARRLNVAEAV
jgi:hypothetical protein